MLLSGLGQFLGILLSLLKQRYGIILYIRCILEVFLKRCWTTASDLSKNMSDFAPHIFKKINQPLPRSQIRDSREIHNLLRISRLIFFDIKKPCKNTLKAPFLASKSIVIAMQKHSSCKVKA